MVALTGDRNIDEELWEDMKDPDICDVVQMMSYTLSAATGPPQQAGAATETEPYANLGIDHFSWSERHRKPEHAVTALQLSIDDYGLFAVGEVRFLA